MVWDAMYKALQEPLADLEWGVLMYMKNEREIVVEAAKKRSGKDRPLPFKRVDWLGDHAIFRGLEKDPGFIETRLLPGTTSYPETWLLKFSSS